MEPRPGLGVYGLTISASDVTVQGLVVSGFGATAILVLGNDALIQDNYLGTDSTGTISEANVGAGIWVSATGATIGGTASGSGNLLSGNDGAGIVLAGASSTLIQGNLIGTDVSGTKGLGNGAMGILLYAGGTGNTIGGTSSAARNIIADNGSNGYRFGIEDDSSGTLIEGNYVGTDITGSVALGNAAGGIFVAASDNTIGGVSSGAGNLISGNVANGIYIYLTSEILVQGNLIGTDANGTSALGSSVGIFQYASSDNTIGGLAAGDGNLISGNGNGVDLDGGDGNLVQGNHIGTDESGSSLLVTMAMAFKCLTHRRTPSAERPTCRQRHIRKSIRWH